MNYTALIKDIQKKVEEVSEKYKMLEKELPANKDSKEKEHVHGLMKELEMLNRNIQDQYEQLSKEEQTDERKLSEIEKTIYNSIRSFNNAYTSAGSIFKIQ